MLNSLKIPLFFYFGVATATNVINKYMFSISIAPPEIYWRKNKVVVFLQSVCAWLAIWTAKLNMQMVKDAPIQEENW